jgi:hypothetical protein
VDNNFEPLILNRDMFLDHYKTRGLTEIIHGLSWVTESFGLIDQMRKDPSNSSLKNRFMHEIIPELKKEPVGDKAFTRLNEIEASLTTDISIDMLEEMIDALLRELSKGYRILLQEYTAR